MRAPSGGGGAAAASASLSPAPFLSCYISVLLFLFSCRRYHCAAAIGVYADNAATLSAAPRLLLFASSNVINFPNWLLGSGVSVDVTTIVLL